MTYLAQKCLKTYAITYLRGLYTLGRFVAFFVREVTFLTKTCLTFPKIWTSPFDCIEMFYFSNNLNPSIWLPKMWYFSQNLNQSILTTWSCSSVPKIWTRPFWLPEVVLVFPKFEPDHFDYLKLFWCSQNFEQVHLHLKHAGWMANSGSPDQTVHKGAVWCGPSLFAQILLYSCRYSTSWSVSKMSFKLLFMKNWVNCYNHNRYHT